MISNNCFKIPNYWPVFPGMECDQDLALRCCGNVCSREACAADSLSRPWPQGAGRGGAGCAPAGSSPSVGSEQSLPEAAVGGASGSVFDGSVQLPPRAPETWRPPSCSIDLKFGQQAKSFVCFGDYFYYLAPDRARRGVETSEARPPAPCKNSVQSWAGNWRCIVPMASAAAGAHLSGPTVLSSSGIGAVGTSSRVSTCRTAAPSSREAGFAETASSSLLSCEDWNHPRP